MNSWCLANTGAEAPWVALSLALVLIVAGAAMLRHVRLRRGLLMTAATLAAVAGLILAPAPAFTAAADSLGTACPSAEQTPAVVAPAPVAPEPVAPTLTLVGATLGDFVWIDANRDGLQDPEEKPAVGAQITLLNAATGQTVTTGFDGRPISPTQTTDGAGRYSFTALAAGGYLLRLEPSTSVTGEVIFLPFGTYSTRITVLDETGAQVFDSEVTTTACTGTESFFVFLPGVGHAFTVAPEPQGIVPITLTASPVVGSLTTVNAGDDDLIDSDLDAEFRQTLTPITLIDGQIAAGIDIGLDPAVGRYYSAGC